MFTNKNLVCRRFLRFLVILIGLHGTALVHEAIADSTNAYVLGEVIMRVTPVAHTQLNLNLKSAGGNSAQTGIAAVDAVLGSYGVTNIKSFPLVLANESLASSLGLNRILIATVDPASNLAELAGNLKVLPGIEIASANTLAQYKTVPNDPLYADQWGHDNQGQFLAGEHGNHENGNAVGEIGMDSDIDLAWDLPQQYGDSTVVIAILDTGVDTDHPDLRLVPGYNVATGNDQVDDTDGHGTNCAGIAAAIADNGIGVAGVAGGCSIMPIKVTLLTGSNQAIGICWATDNGADIISMSFGGGYNLLVESAIQYAFQEGVVMFAAAGNILNPSIGGNVEFPAGYTEVISVGAASPCGEWKNFVSCDGESVWMSNWNDSVDLVAPTILPTTDILGSTGFDPGDYFKWFGGTSCSTPFAAGVAALLISADPSLLPANIKYRLTSTARDIEACGYDVYTGWGLINANNALLNQPYPNPSANTIYVGPNETITQIQNAIDIADDCSVILVKPGFYTQRFNFKSKNVTVRSTLGPLFTTIWNTSHLPGYNGVTFNSGETEYSVLEGFTIVGGYYGVVCESSRPTIRNNVINGSGVAGIYAGSPLAEPNLQHRAPAIIENNTVLNCPIYGILTLSYYSAPIIRNCIVTANDTGIAAEICQVIGDPPCLPAPLIEYCDVYGNDVNYLVGSGGPGSFSEDPLLNLDFTLQVGSPCIDNGDPDPKYNDPNGSRNDIGALPYLVDSVNVPADYSTIQEAIGAVNYQGGKVTVDSGTYVETDIDFLGKAITVKAIHDPGKTTIAAPTNYTKAFLFRNGEDSNSVLDGFRILGGRNGVACYNSSPTIIRCMFKDQMPGIDEGALNLWGTTTNTVGRSPAKIINCTFMGSSRSGIVDRSWDPPVIKNVIVYNNVEYGINWDTYLNKPWEAPELSYNCVNSNGTDYGGGITDSGVGSIFVDPLLYPGGELSFLSPCIDAGDPDSIYNDPDGSRNDMGAWPYQPPQAPPPRKPELEEGELPYEFALNQNYPNPFNPVTVISFSLPVASEYELTIFNILGQEVKTFSGHSEPGTVDIHWDASAYGSGIYLYKLTAGTYTATKKMIVLK